MAKIDRVQEVSVDLLKPYENNAKINSEEQVQKIAERIQNSETIYDGGETWQKG